MLPQLCAQREKLASHFRRLYGDRAESCVRRLLATLGRYGVGESPRAPRTLWSAEDTLLISYPDIVQSPGEPPLRSLARFLRTHLGGKVNTIHVLPFSPSSSDEGFSVMDFRAVDPAWGSWKDIENLASSFGLMADLVLNHVSRRSSWARDFTHGILPAARYFIDVDPAVDLSAVVRPRNLPLLSPLKQHGEEIWLWTTFSEDQLDLDYRNPDVLFELIDVLLLYVAKGARIIRMDAIAYLWKEIGTSCIHLPQTHEVVKLFRTILSLVAPEVILLTETNVPHRENVSYFGEGDEAQMVYQFALPPLLLYTLRKGSAEALTGWAQDLEPPPRGCTFLNFTASHDGVGVRPLEGIVGAGEIEWLAAEVRSAGGHVSTRKLADGGQSPYELNVSYFDALAGAAPEPADADIARFLCSQAIMLSMRGIPAVYFHSLVATRNYHRGVEERGYPRAINRRRWDAGELGGLLSDPASLAARVFRRYAGLLELRRAHAAFHPDGAQRVLDLDPSIFAFERVSPEGEERIACLNNVTGRTVEIPCPLAGRVHDLVSDRDLGGGKTGRIRLRPYQTVWLVEQG